MRHAALRVDEQHIIWQQVIMKVKNIASPASCQKEDEHNL
jgi:hypothetical protein